jgi:hypothetical protein
MPIRRNNNIIKQVKPNIIRKVNNQIVRKPNNVQPVQKTISINNDNKYNPIDKIWDNEIVYIIGGGPSLKNFDWNQLKGKKIIAINRAYEVLPWAEVLYWTDSRFYKWYKSDIDKLNNIKVTCRPFHNIPQDVILLKSNNYNKLDMRPSYISHGNNSGYGAINLAVKLGAKKIYLLGYDMNSKPNQSHWHSGYQSSHNHTIYNKMISQFDGLPKELKELNIEVFNANPNSKLEVFRKCSLEDAINDRAYNPFRNV